MTHKRCPKSGRPMLSYQRARKTASYFTSLGRATVLFHCEGCGAYHTRLRVGAGASVAVVRP